MFFLLFLRSPRPSFKALYGYNEVHVTILSDTCAVLAPLG